MKKFKVGSQVKVDFHPSNAPRRLQESYKVVESTSEVLIVVTKSGDRYRVNDEEDTVTIISRKDALEMAKKELSETAEKLASLQKEVDYLEKYDSEEEYIAEQINNLLTIHGSKATKEDKISAMKQIIILLKEKAII